MPGRSVVLDTSAIISLIQSEPQAEAIAEALADAANRAISAATLLEASIVADGARDPVRSARFDALIDALDLEVVAVTDSQVRLARQAFRDYGRGSGHPARLNFGDCFSYALARERRAPLLYVGADFTHTDVAPAL